MKLRAYAGTGAGDATFENTLFKNNSASGVGGALRMAGGTFSCTNCTFTSNSSTGSGGVLQIAIAGGTTTLQNCTLDSNTSGAVGGAINTAAVAATLVIGNTVMTNNTATTSNNNCSIDGAMTVTSRGYNYMDTNAECNLGGTGDDEAATNDPLLSALADNSSIFAAGGTTIQTMAQQTGSTLIDGGDNTNCPSTDARGYTRSKTVSDPCDIGAYEY